MVTLASVLLGALVGLIQALTGAGGGILAVPLLVFGLSLSVATAAPVALFAVCLSAAFGAALGLRAGTVRYRAALWMAAIGSLTAPLGVWLAHRLPNAPLTLLFAGVLGFVAYRHLRREPEVVEDANRQPPPCQIDASSGRLRWTAACTRILAFAGATAGGLSGLLGVGGGFVIVPALARTTDIPLKSIITTSLAVIALVSLSGVLASAAAGRVTWPIALPFAAGAVAGILGGRFIAGRLAPHHVQRAFGIVAAVVAIGMVVTAGWLVFAG